MESLTDAQKGIIKHMRNGVILVWQEYSIFLDHPMTGKVQTVLLDDLESLIENDLVEWRDVAEEDLNTYQLTELGKTINI